MYLQQVLLPVRVFASLRSRSVNVYLSCVRGKGGAAHAT